MALSFETERILTVMRQIAWEHAKGELQAILNTYYEYGEFEDISEKFKEFITYIEDNHLG
jgi:hypothetical protein